MAYFEDTQDLAMLSFAPGQNVALRWVHCLAQLVGQLTTS